jgi:hypothetical protein
MPLLSEKGIAIEELVRGALVAYVLDEKGDIMTPTGYVIAADQIERPPRNMAAGAHGLGRI